MRTYHITPLPIGTGMHHRNVPPKVSLHKLTLIAQSLSAKRDNSRQLAGGNARARSSGGIICYNTFRFRDWKGRNVIRAHDTI